MANEEQRPVNDRREGIIRDPVNMGGEIVSYVKDIGNGDQGYDANIRQVLIMRQDGSEEVVPETAILRGKRVMAETDQSEPDRRPEHTLPPFIAGAEEGGLDRNAQERPGVDDPPKPFMAASGAIPKSQQGGATRAAAGKAPKGARGAKTASRAKGAKRAAGRAKRGK